MVETLPRTVQLKLEQTLAQWQSWRCVPTLNKKPEVLRLLSGGLSNYSILVEADRSFVVRIDGVSPSAVGLNRQAEWHVLQSASEAGVAPFPRYYNPELGSLVCDYLEPDSLQQTTLGTIATLLRDIHRLPAIHSRLDIPERITRYRKHVEHRHREVHPLLDASHDKVLETLDKIDDRNTPAVLCHNDLLAANRLACGGNLFAIDWEYCAMGSPWFDLAVVTAGDSLEATGRDILLSSYLGREAEPADKHTLSQHEYIYRYLELMWFSALDDPVERERHLSEERLQRLRISP